MVSQETQTNPTSSSSLHHFSISNPISSQPHFDKYENPHFDDSYNSDIIRVNSSNPFSDHQSLGNTHFPTIQSLEERMSRSINLVHDHSSVVVHPDDHSDMGHTRHLMDLLGAPNEATHGSNRLSLSLGSQALHSPQYRQRTFSSELMQQAYSNLVGSSGDQENCNPGDYSFIGSTSFTAFSVSNSMYLKPAQSMLEEVIDLGSKDIELKDVKRLFMCSRGLCSELRAELMSNGFLSADKHDLQINFSKLITLLEQVEGRYDEYFQRMEDLISSFEMIAGDGAAKCYTALALQAMSRHFCSLRDAIVTQIKVIRKKISPDLPKIGSGLSHLSLLDRDGRNSNSRMSLQQIGLIQGTHRQAWRPIRGLPETSVAILRAWLFEHFLHPYPNDSEKLTLASQTGLTKNQVSNWFINARVRLWKPMIEEMYKEEFGDSSVDSSGEGQTDKTEDQ
ncbi:BEL1-like homeodomain protein 11 [Chenopodium quinoa]|uniref:BEL1-like homeodomain protein 11 n=1 Tax=Chenopodium quinoa TaxID=63459 RepID=UPI000B774817|nr:BEL1-like homeodomain protein 11 [Chenopodium quinoa]XP_021758322.1 BEL1-like homeodomain protein 11 [Chenopodium quinoa]